MNSTLSKRDKHVVFAKRDIILAVKEFVDSHHYYSFFVLDEDDMYNLLMTKAKAINSNYTWSTVDYSPNDIIKHFKKKYRVKYLCAENTTKSKLYAFKKKRFFFF